MGQEAGPPGRDEDHNPVLPSLGEPRELRVRTRGRGCHLHWHFATCRRYICSEIVKSDVNVFLKRNRLILLGTTPCPGPVAPACPGPGARVPGQSPPQDEREKAPTRPLGRGPRGAEVLPRGGSHVGLRVLGTGTGRVGSQQRAALSSRISWDTGGQLTPRPGPGSPQTGWRCCQV